MAKQKPFGRHDYSARPAPDIDDLGHFIPSGPRGVEKHPDHWTMIDKLDSLKALAKNPINATTMITREAPIVRAHMLGQDLWVVSDPDIIRYLFVTNASNLDLHPVRQALLRPVLQDGLISAEGKTWKRARHLLSPVFTPRNTNGFAPGMVKSIERILPELFDAPRNAVNLSDEMLKLTYGILSDALFSGQLEQGSEETLKDIAALLSHMGQPNPLDMISAPKWIPRLNHIFGQAPIRRVRKMIHSATLERQAKQKAGEALPDDFLTLLLQAGDDEQAPLSPTEIEDQIMTFIGAGHETTSRAMSWMFYLLSNDTKARDRLEAEVDSLDINTPPERWSEAMPWSMACFEETMRLFPPAPIISRRIIETIETDEYQGHQFDAGAGVMINLWALHRHKKLWERPDSFIPDRFFGENRIAIKRFQYLPFGLGRRVCIGQRFAMQEAAILIALMARRYRFDYDGERPPWPVMRITVQADNHMPMRVTPRNERQ